MHQAAVNIADHDSQFLPEHDRENYVVRSKFFYKFTPGVYASIEMHVRSLDLTSRRRDKKRDQLHSALHYLQVACVKSQGAGIAERAELEHRLTQVKWHNHEGPKFTVREFRDYIRLFKRLGLLSEQQRGVIVFEFWTDNDHKNYPTQPQVEQICVGIRTRKQQRQRKFRARQAEAAQ